MIADTTDLEDLRRAGLRVTAPRVAVLGAVRQGGHLTVDELAGAARERLGTVSTQAVYDVLSALVAAGLVRRITPPGGAAHFEARVGDNHHHLICRVCGSVQDVDCAVGEAPCLTPPDVAGYEIDEAEVIFKGVCPTCAVATDVATAPPTREETESTV